MKSATLNHYSLLFLAVTGMTHAHGTIDIFTADGVAYAGPESMDVDPESLPSDSPVRQIYTLEPILSTATDLASPNMTCGPAPASSAPATASVTAGSTISFHYRSGNNGVWPHDVGPVITYMYRCTSETCMPAAGEEGWFKIDQQGMDEKGIWAQTAMMHNESINVVVPSTVPDGDYLVRHEVIALQNAVNRGQAEFYISCTQVHVKGGSIGSGSLDGVEMVAFPGGYAEDDPGLFVPDLYDHDGKVFPYAFPGPVVLGVSLAVAVASPSPSSRVPSTVSTATVATRTAPAPSSTSVLSSCIRPKQSNSRAPVQQQRLIQGRLNPASLRHT
ncbi:hypothetical protein EXIGLDRAFT_689474 [Exidia glandulosa HHB12029]|uniref:AA9 family lytic polysaccharide monooxygenase n=1 Tax=Exidia glandulosa HHB12029 TaxID=1314781 RepID=A0A166N8W1_EXIGL|nr:hypothetical protein EXIGLDRAFT_689474 [Exidia glandulosa HHB12029]